MDNALSLTIGSTLSFEIRILDSSDQPVSLAGATAATLSILTSSVGGTIILSRSTTGGTLQIGTGKLTATLNQATADALPAGFFIGEAAVQFASGWQHTSTFRVVIRRALTSHA